LIQSNPQTNKNIGAFSDDQKSVSDIDPLRAFLVKPTPDFVQGASFGYQNPQKKPTMHYPAEQED